MKEKKLSHEKLLKYWKCPDDNYNEPHRYLFVNLINRSKLINKLLEEIHIFPYHKILELGSNVGRNLSYLYNIGYNHLSMIEISKNALDLGRKTYPKLFEKSNVYLGSIEKVLPTLYNEYDVIFTMAVLEHIHDNTIKEVKKQISRLGKYLITIEDENTSSKRHFPRNYEKEFKKVGFRQIYILENLKEFELSHNFKARIFENLHFILKKKTKT